MTNKSNTYSVVRFFAIVEAKRVSVHDMENVGAVKVQIHPP